MHVIQIILGEEPLAITNSKKNYSEQYLQQNIVITTSLLSKNFTPEEIKAIFRHNPKGCGKVLAKAHSGEEYLDNLLNQALKIHDHNYAKSEKSLYVDTLPPQYEIDADGAVWFSPLNEEANKLRPVMISSSPVRIIGIREHLDSHQISVIIAYDYLGLTRSTIITRQQMSEARSLVATLSGQGAPVNSNNARFLVTYLAAYEQAFADVIPRIKVTARFGRGKEGGKFYLPGLASDIEFSPAASGDSSVYNAYAARQGTLAEWVKIVNQLGQGNHLIPQIAILTAFVLPLQRYLQIPNFILDIYGSTSSGKSTTLKLAASVYGRPFDPDALIYQWMNTKLAVEQLASVCSELPVFLDDAQHCSDDLKRTVIYMIANGRGKARANARGMRETLTWQTVALSTSEEPLHEASEHEGVRGRLLPVGGLTPPFPVGSATLVQSLERGISLNHGYAGETFIRHLNRWTAKDWLKWSKRYALLRNELVRSSSSDIVGRVGGYIAAIGVAAEIACPLIGLNFKSDVIVAWLQNHLLEQQSSQNLTLHAIRVLADHYLANRDAFAGTKSFPSSRKALQGISKQNEYVGFSRKTLDSVFAKYKWRPTMILNKFAEAGVLHATEADHHTKKVTFAGVKHRLVCVKWSALLPDDFKGDL